MPSSREKTEIIKKLRQKIKNLETARKRIKETKAKVIARHPKTTRIVRYIHTKKEVFPTIKPEKKPFADFFLQIRCANAFCVANEIKLTEICLLLIVDSLENATVKQIALFGYKDTFVRYWLDVLSERGLIERFMNGKRASVTIVNLNGKKLIAKFMEHYESATTPDPPIMLDTKRQDGKLEDTAKRTTKHFPSRRRQANSGVG